MNSEPVTFLSAIVAASGSVTAVVKWLSRRSGLSRYTRRRDEEADAERAANNDRWRAWARHAGGAELEREFMVIEARLEAGIGSLREKHHQKTRGSAAGGVLPGSPA